MKKIILLSTLALVALASCTKNEIVAPANAEQEISYQVVNAGPMTKAAAAFAEANHFVSYAYQHQNAVTAPGTATKKLNETISWDAAGAQANYIEGAEISFNSNKWNASTTYYWPKASNLSFYAWSINKPTVALDGATPAFANTTGITVADYTIGASSNKNVDFMVAEVAYNQTNNTAVTGSPSRSWTEGVPTVFHHQLSSFIFKAQTVKKTGFSTATAFNYEEETGKEHYFYVTKITFKNVKDQASYTQLVANPETTSSWGSYAATTADYVMFDASKEGVANAEDIPGAPAGTKGVKATSTSQGQLLNPTNSEFQILLPQVLADEAVVEIEYWAVDNIGGTKVAKKYDATTAPAVTEKKLNLVFTSGWKQEKQYNLTFRFSLDEILWDPTVENWSGPSNTGWNI